MFVYPRWEINATVWWQYIFPLAVLGLLALLWSLRRWSRAPLAGVLVYIVLLLPSLGFANIYFFLYSFVADHWQYLACLGIITPCASGIVLLAGQLKSWQPWFERGHICCWPEHYSSSPGSKAGCIAMPRRFIGRLLLVILSCWLAQVNLVDILYQENRIAEAMNLFEEELRIEPAPSFPKAPFIVSMAISRILSARIAHD